MTIRLRQLLDTATRQWFREACYRICDTTSVRDIPALLATINTIRTVGGLEPLPLPPEYETYEEN